MVTTPFDDHAMGDRLTGEVADKARETHPDKVLAVAAPPTPEPAAPVPPPAPLDHTEHGEG